jgi:DNA primase
LTWCGVDNEQIQRWNIESLQKKDLLDFTTRKTVNLKFKTKVIPGEELNSSNKDHKPFAEYLIKRKVPLNALPFHVSPNDTGRNANRIIIPYIFKGKVVGHTSRYLDNKTPRYINEQQPGYVFNIDAQRPDWQVCIVTEGIFDALSIDGVALLHNDISEDQSILLASLNKKIIFVPDRDPSGLKLTDRALELGYSVSIPNWDKSVKDVNDAVVKYGKLPTLLSILQFATNSKIKIEMRKKKIE